MKEPDYLNIKFNLDSRKKSINNNLFQNHRHLKDQLIVHSKKNMGKKYMQEPNIFRQKPEQIKKQHRQVLMSEQFIKSSKLYRLLLQKMNRSDTMHDKQVNLLAEDKSKLFSQVSTLKTQLYQQKLSLWQLKNQLLQFRSQYQHEQAQSNRLSQPYEQQNEMSQNKDTQPQEKEWTE